MGKISLLLTDQLRQEKVQLQKFLAKQLNYVYCDTGAMYRAITYLAFANQIDIQTEEPL